MKADDAARHQRFVQGEAGVEVIKQVFRRRQAQDERNNVPSAASVLARSWDDAIPDADELHAAAMEIE